MIDNKEIILCELDTVTYSHFGKSVTEAEFTENSNEVEVKIPWEFGIWTFKGERTHQAGTFLLVEETPEGDKVLGTTEVYYSLLIGR